MLRVRVAFSGFVGGPGLSTFYFLTPLQDTAAATRVVASVQQLIGTNIKNFWPSNVIAQVSPDVDVITAATGLITDTLSVPAPPLIPGTGGTSKAPPAVAALLRLSTNTFVAGRRVRGRSFISPLAGPIVTSDGLVGDTYANGQAGVAASVAASLGTGDFWVVWHRPKLGVGGTAAPITATNMPTKLAVLVSRRD